MADRNAPAGAGFLVEEFITSITTQLDRVQDALRIKAVNRPLTYALKELHLELKVFVDMDAQGQVLLRAAGPNEAGASTLAMDFTTITKPMIEENTISLAATRSTPLDSLGLKPEEQQRLERLGVTNLAQLDRLKGSTGVSTVARLAEMPVDRLRRALQVGVPKIGGVVPPRSTPAPAPRAAPPAPAPRPPIASPTPPVRMPPVQATPRPLPQRPMPLPIDPRRRFLKPMAEEAAAQSLDADAWPDDSLPPMDAPAQVLEVHPATRTLTLGGSHLLHEDYPPEVRLNGEALAIEELDHDRLVVSLPQGFEPGALEVRLGDQPATCFALVHPVGPVQDEHAPYHPQDPHHPPGMHTARSPSNGHDTHAAGLAIDDPWAPTAWEGHRHEA